MITPVWQAYMVALILVGCAVLTHFIINMNFQIHRSLDPVEQTLLSFVYLVYTGFVGLIVFTLIKDSAPPIDANFTKLVSLDADAVQIVWLLFLFTLFWLYIYLNINRKTEPQKIQQTLFVFCFFVLQASLLFILVFSEPNIQFIIGSFLANGIMLNTVYAVLEDIKKLGQNTGDRDNKEAASISGFVNYSQYLFWLTTGFALYLGFQGKTEALK